MSVLDPSDLDAVKDRLQAVEDTTMQVLRLRGAARRVGKTAAHRAVVDARLASSADVPNLVAELELLRTAVVGLCGCAPDCAERIACPTVGVVGHWGCGWCTEHDRPRHRCTARECVIPPTPEPQQLDGAVLDEEPCSTCGGAGELDWPPGYVADSDTRQPCPDCDGPTT